MATRSQLYSLYNIWERQLTASKFAIEHLTTQAEYIMETMKSGCLYLSKRLHYNYIASTLKLLRRSVLKFITSSY